jgi:hypothetical protein
MIHILTHLYRQARRAVKEKKVVGQSPCQPAFSHCRDAIDSGTIQPKKVTPLLPGYYPGHKHIALGVSYETVFQE